MLVLSRKKDESIVINGNIVVTVVEVRGNKVRLGIVAPDSVPISRPDAKSQGSTDTQQPEAIRKRA